MEPPRIIRDLKERRESTKDNLVAIGVYFAVIGAIALGMLFVLTKCS